MNEKRVMWMFGILVALVVILALALAYILLLRPQFTGYVFDKQIEAQQILVSNIVAQVNQNGYVQIPLSDDQVLVLVPYVPPKQNVALNQSPPDDNFSI